MSRKKRRAGAFYCVALLCLALPLLGLSKSTEGQTSSLVTSDGEVVTEEHVQSMVFASIELMMEASKSRDVSRLRQILHPSTHRHLSDKEILSRLSAIFQEHRKILPSLDEGYFSFATAPKMIASGDGDVLDVRGHLTSEDDQRRLGFEMQFTRIAPEEWRLMRFHYKIQSKNQK